MRITVRAIAGTLAIACWLTPMLRAQSVGTGPASGGTAALRQAERMLGHTKRVLLIAAHPDDEDSELLTTLVRGEGAEAAYLALSRGEGGQNLIGPELGEELGLIRTGELLGARSLDGARQYFTRAFDFGFSKSIEETGRFWPRDSVLKDVVRIVRRFRPQVIVAMFSGTPRDGHGQHQFSGWAAQQAFLVAGDSTRFPELLRQEGLAPWAPFKLYRSARFDTSGVTTVLQGGVLDPDIGQSYRQIAMRGRSLHRSQDMGALQEMGPSAVRLTLLARADGKRGGREALWDGVDTSATSSGGIEASDRERHAATAAAIRAGLVFDATTRDGRVVPGQRVMVRLSAWNAGSAPVLTTLELLPRPDWAMRPCASPRVLVAPGTVATCDVEVAIPGDAEYTTPYFLRRERVGGGGMYQWAGDPMAWGEPFEPPALQARFAFATTGEGGREHEIAREVLHRFRDQMIGEVRHPILVVPRVDVKLDPPAQVWSTTRADVQRFTVTLQHGAGDRTSGTVELELPSGWPRVPSQPFSLSREEERETLVFEVRQPGRLASGTYEIRAVARDTAGRRYDAGLYQIEYPHIRLRARSRAAVSAVHAAPIAAPSASRVGYIRGAADRVPEALEGIGLRVELLDAAAIERADLSRFDVIVVGSRAYETEPALGENNGRLLEYVRGGGRLLVQYQQQPFFNGRFAPAPLTLGQPHDRVTNEHAPVQILAEGDPVFSRPNRIEAADWMHWVQERGLYFARTWDSTYRPLLALSDSGEAPLRGGLLIRPLGKGTYLYTGLSFFRQLPAGVRGAFRLFLNLLDARAVAPAP